MILCRWPISAPRVPRLGSLVVVTIVVVVLTVMILSGPDLRFYSNISLFIIPATLAAFLVIVRNKNKIKRHDLKLL
jgi:hypothetical protein